jgi:hypothetical protein
VGEGRSTLPGDDGLATARRGRLLRRLGVVVLVAFVGLGATGFFGVRSASVRAAAGGYELVVQYPKATRPGLASPWGFQIRREGGFGQDPVTVATSLDWLSLFDENGRNPAPSAEYVDGEMVVWEFDPPQGDVLSFEFDARLGPSVQSGLTATTQLREGNVVLLEVRYHTRVFP